LIIIPKYIKCFYLYQYKQLDLIGTNMVLYGSVVLEDQKMLKISKLADYAVIILGSLVFDQPRMVSASWVANATHLELPTVSKILKLLAKAGLVLSLRGSGGGYRLVRSAKEVTVAEVVSAIEGRLAVTECCAISNACMLDSLCTIKENWRVINKVIFSVLEGLTLYDVIHPLDIKDIKSL